MKKTFLNLMAGLAACTGGLLSVHQADAQAARRNYYGNDGFIPQTLVLTWEKAVELNDNAQKRTLIGLSNEGLSPDKGGGGVRYLAPLLPSDGNKRNGLYGSLQADFSTSVLEVAVEQRGMHGFGKEKHVGVREMLRVGNQVGRVAGGQRRYVDPTFRAGVDLFYQNKNTEFFVGLRGDLILFGQSFYQGVVGAKINLDALKAARKARLKQG